MLNIKLPRYVLYIYLLVKIWKQWCRTFTKYVVLILSRWMSKSLLLMSAFPWRFIFHIHLLYVRLSLDDVRLSFTTYYFTFTCLTSKLLSDDARLSLNIDLFHIYRMLRNFSKIQYVYSTFACSMSNFSWMLSLSLNMCSPHLSARCQISLDDVSVFHIYLLDVRLLRMMSVYSTFTCSMSDFSGWCQRITH